MVFFSGWPRSWLVVVQILLEWSLTRSQKLRRRNWPWCHVAWVDEQTRQTRCSPMWNMDRIMFTWSAEISHPELKAAAIWTPGRMKVNSRFLVGYPTYQTKLSFYINQGAVVSVISPTRVILEPVFGELWSLKYICTTLIQAMLYPSLGYCFYPGYALSPWILVEVSYTIFKMK